MPRTKRVSDTIIKAAWMAPVITVWDSVCSRYEYIVMVRRDGHWHGIIIGRSAN